MSRRSRCCDMEEVLKSGRYIYVHEAWNKTSKVIDAHHVIHEKSNKRMVVPIFIAGLILLSTCFVLWIKIGSQMVWTSLGVFLLLRCMHHNSLEKESVLVLPALGVQLETHYTSGRVKRRFVPMCKIMKPVLNECVTPMTCYWSLSLLVCGEGEMMLVFQRLRPPVKILAHIWRALSDVTDAKRSLADERL